jgi:hypothetical protein
MELTTEDRAAWERDGVIIKRRVLPEDLMAAYCKRRENIEPAGWPYPTPYVEERELRELGTWSALTEFLGELVGGEMGLHLTLTGWVSTERSWHADGYLNPENVGNDYAAVWMALDDIDPRSGPFEYVPGSHHWLNHLTRSDVFEKLTVQERQSPDWPKLAERFVTDYWQQTIDQQGAQIRQFIPAEQGDILVWHPWVVHRGSEPKVPGMMRKAVICHYSVCKSRQDFGNRWVQGPGGKWFKP